MHTYVGSYADLMILTDGQIVLIPASGMLAPGVPALTNPQFLALEGITYKR